jgi:hypothetical protein
MFDFRYPVAKIVHFSLKCKYFATKIHFLMNLLAYMQKRCYFCSQNESGARQGRVPEAERMAESAELRAMRIAGGGIATP